MANPKRSLPSNTPGEFFVDETCIDCDTCRWMAPEVFFQAQGQSAVKSQPLDPKSRHRALQAMISCPTASIGTRTPASEIADIRREFPILIEDPVYHCGFHSPKSYGAASYFIQRSDGNVLVDSPRQSETLAAKIEAMGGVKWLFLTHSDDVADHEYWHERFNCIRILHSADIFSGTKNVEMKLMGEQTIDLAPDLRLIPLPGHTRGSTALLFQEEFLFTGDHLAFSARRNHLHAFRDACWFSWPETIKSMEKLKAYPFTWVLPGHGQRFHSNRDEIQNQMDICIQWMRSIP